MTAEPAGGVPSAQAAAVISTLKNTAPSWHWVEWPTWSHADAVGWGRHRGPRSLMSGLNARSLALRVQETSGELRYNVQAVMSSAHTTYTLSSHFAEMTSSQSGLPGAPSRKCNRYSSRTASQDGSNR
jgi:hypothetical protein